MAKPSTRTTQVPAAGLAMVTDSSESPSADWPARTHVPLRAVEDEQVEVGRRVGRVADGRAQARRARRDGDGSLDCCQVGDRRAVAERAAQGRADGPSGERAEQVGHRVAARDRHADRRRRDDVGVGGDGGAEDRRRQRERRELGVRGPARLDGDLPDARRADWTGCGSSGATARRPPGPAASSSRARVAVDPDAVRVEPQEPGLAGAGRGARAAEVDLERRRAGRDLEEVAPRLVAGDRAGERLAKPPAAVKSYGTTTVFMRLVLDARRRGIVEVEDRRVGAVRRRVDR